MANMFEKDAAVREAEQQKMTDTVPAEDEKRTTLSLSLTVSDKKALMAAERETTIAAIIHEWVQEHLEEVDK